MTTATPSLPRMEAVIAPTGRLDLAAVQEFHAALLAKPDKDLTVDLQQVTFIGALCLQLFIAASRHAAKAGLNLKIANISDEVRDQISAMGVTPAMLEEGAI